MRRSYCGEDVGRLCCSVVRAVDRQSKDPGSNPSAVESVFFPQKDFKFFKFEFNSHLFAIYEFEIVSEDTCRQRILSDTQLVILR